MKAVLLRQIPFVFLLLACLVQLQAQSVSAAPLPDPSQGDGGPILVITSPVSIFGTYYAEILRAEGLNAFAVLDIDAVDAEVLEDYDAVVLASMPLTSGQAGMFSDWVTSGGNLIAMRPDASLASLLGLIDTGTTLSEGYIKVDTSRMPGAGIVGETMQYHGVANRYYLDDAVELAALYSSANTAAGNPAVTLRNLGSNGGQAAAFAYDLSTSIVYTRQGNPAWEAQERDGLAPIRSNDKFYGPASGDFQPNWIDLDKVSIPQADEQQRLLANLLIQMTLDRKPLPRFWYFPRGEKAVLVMTGDDHANNGTVGRFEQFIEHSPPGCSVADWECVRGTSYIFPNFLISNSQIAAYAAQGFEIGLHVNTGCADYTPLQLEGYYSQQIAQFSALYPSAPPLMTERHHCIAWSDWATGAKVQAAFGIRLDTSYYYWPSGWVDNKPGVFTGSAMAMRFADINGDLINVYQAATQMTDESGQLYPYTVDTLLDRAIGPEGYYGAYVINAHTDVARIPESDTAIPSALSRGVPIVSSAQLLEWLEGRDGSSFSDIGWNGTALSFTVTRAAGANGLQSLLPMHSANGVLTGISRNGSNIEFEVDVVKGIVYARFDALSGVYAASYEEDVNPPVVASATPAEGAINVSPGIAISVTFDDVLDPSTISSETVELRTADDVLVPAIVSYSAATRTITLTPVAPLATASTYTLFIKGGMSDPRVKDLAGNALISDVSWAFTTGASPCPCSAWESSELPGSIAEDDSEGVELGVKFRVHVNGYITGIRFYKEAGNVGVHVGNLWSLGGTHLAMATFGNETSTGWQQVDFSNPVPVTAGAVYVASYYAPNGHYAADANYFAMAGVENGYVQLLRDGVSGGNGVYKYGSNSIFPDQTWQSTNYWVDVVFIEDMGADETPPEVAATIPAAEASDIDTGIVIAAVFSEALDPSTVNAQTFELRDALNIEVISTVSYNPATRTALLMPASRLDASALYTATLRGGVDGPGIKDMAGNALVADFSWSFTTMDVAPAGCPCSAWGPADAPSNPSDADTGGVELGVKFRADVDGYVTGIRFYKGAGNTGTHVGNLWTLSGTLLATATFVNETATGWQQVNFSSPVPISSGVVYVASYFAPNGGYAGDNGYFAASGVDSGPLHLLRNGESGDNGLYRYGSVSDFPDESWQSTNYWVDVVFVENDAPPPSSSCPCSAWGPADAPSNPSDADTGSVELGVKFRADVDGYVTGIRFYKGAGNTGTHVGNLWTLSGTLLATATFVNETATGWQQVNFSSPVPISSGVVYVASYFAPNGGYAGDNGYFAASGVDSGPLHLLRNGESGDNGLYRYGSVSDFPDESWQSTNYWVDVVFTPE